MNLLFVCTANEQRSPTAASLFDDNPKHIAKSCGIHPLANTPISKEAILWADVIFCMDSFHKSFILNHFPEAKSKILKVLNIPDNYSRDDPELIEILRDKLEDYL